MMTNSIPTLRQVLEQARNAAYQFMVKGESSGLGWDEETVTNTMLVEVPPLVKVVPFTKLQEGGDRRFIAQRRGTGADWLWWWVGDDGISFGMLVQAKRLKKDKNEEWSIEFGYKSGKQWDDLHATAKTLQVAPCYALYLGPPNYRKFVECGMKNHPSDYEQCDRCIRKSVSFYPSLLAEGIGVDPQLAYAQSIPMESLADPRTDTETPLAQQWLYGLTTELQEFLTAEADSVPTAVAKQLVSKVRERRALQFSQQVDTAVTVDDRISDDLMFHSLPLDKGHFSVPYFPQMLRGLRRTPPGYVLNVLNGKPPVGLETTSLAGMVIISAGSFR
ncbi:hypothetical protein [Glutamicibacter creatinolyticus]|uniref:hypothetical protein n=1 Tax=Glutamicibacter creatinolyticus TaxID=162496 RepID=UPI0031E46529